MKVKICGVTNIEDAREAVRLGAWAIGLVNFADSPRRCDATVAVEISSELRRRCEIAGVFVNPSLEEVTAAAADQALSIVQLHGDEGPSFCTEVARRTGCKVAKAIRVASAADVHAAEAYRTDFHLFDTRHGELWGGSGESFDWELLAARRSNVPTLLAGGLRPDNVAEAIELARPFGIDVASGVEEEPGRKDRRLMADLFEAVRSVEPAAAR